MRIIAGQRKGMRLVAPPGRDVRPSSDKLRGAVMSMLGGFFDGERVLDVCAGTGAMALELLSRGCGQAVAIEKDPAALQSLHANAAHTRLADKLEVRPGDAPRELERLAQQGRQFDLVYVDPPYDAGLYGPILQRLPPLLTLAAEVLVESRDGLPDDLLGERWRRTTQRKYGSTVLDRLELVEPEA